MSKFLILKSMQSFKNVLSISRQAKTVAAVLDNQATKAACLYLQGADLMVPKVAGRTLIEIDGTISLSR